ncbi:MAG: BamA/TamA family outer membrane protein [Candidatus Eiseniibacteriota bacterium]
MSGAPRRDPTGSARIPFVALAFVFVLSVAASALVAVASPARAQDTPPSGGLPTSLPDTGWVEIGGGGEFGADDPFADLPPDSSLAIPPEGGRIVPYLEYNRVDALTLGLDLVYSPDEGWMPEFRVRFARAFGTRDGDQGDGAWVWDMRLEQPLLKDRSLRLGLAQYDKTDHDDFGQVGTIENTLSSMFWKWDYQDWYDLSGYEAKLKWDFADVWSAEVRYNDDTYGSITEIGYGANGLFRRSEPWRDNPAVDDGVIHGLTFGVGYDSRSDRRLPRRGMWHELEFETAGGDLGGDFGYRRYLAKLRGYISPSPAHIVKARAMLGTTSEGDFLPFQKTFAIGGIGTLRATPFRQYRGRQLFLLNGDWSWEVLRRSSKNAAIKTGLSLVLFTDFGTAWDAPRWDLAHQKPAWDAGLGIGTTDETIRVYFARDLRSEHAAIHTTVRIARSY